MRPRITINRKDGELQIWLNPTGRDLLVRELQRLSEQHDHFHFMPEDMEGEVPVRDRAYQDGAEVIEWGKVFFRPDEWDLQCFPHVVDSADPSGSSET
ncbi:MAG TPA: hypothetical protein VGH13_04445 [Xanthobacteraceae bacterium]